MSRALVLLGFAASFLLVLPLFASGDDALHYQIPPGWVDLVDPATDTSGFPPAPVNEARSGRYVVFAIDPSNVSAIGANASMNVIEAAGTGVVTLAMMRQSSVQASSQSQAMGYDMDVTDVKVSKLGAVDIGEMHSLMATNAGSMRLLQYFIPGRTRIATITYACLPGELDRYRPIFEASAIATTGAYSHRRGIDFGRAFRAGAIGAVVGGIASVIIALVAIVVAKRRKGVPATAARQTVAPMWDCPTCRRRVPMRIGECRCGALRPS